LRIDFDKRGIGKEQKQSDSLVNEIHFYKEKS